MKTCHCLKDQCEQNCGNYVRRYEHSADCFYLRRDFCPGWHICDGEYKTDKEINYENKTD